MSHGGYGARFGRLSTFFERRIHHITPSTITGIQISHFILSSPPLAFAGHGAKSASDPTVAGTAVEGASCPYSPDTSAFVI